MACSYPIVNYTDGSNNGGCCETAQSVCDWLTVHSQGWLQFGGCYGLSKTLTAGTVSMHATGRAIDVNVYQYRLGSPQNAACKFLLNTYITPNACTFGIQRMVFEGRMWTSGLDTTLTHDEWPTAPSTMLHTSALHIEITPDLCGTFRYQDVNAVMCLTSSLVYVGGTIGDPINPRVETLAPSTTGNGVDGTAVGGGVSAPSPHGTAENSPNDTNPVWSSTVWELGACAACGDQFNALLDSQVLQATHCGGTGAICINRTNGQTCSTGTAPTLGDFPGAIKDFIWWGDGAYGLSKDGMHVWGLGEAIDPVFEIGTPEEVGPWEKILGVGPSTIAVSKTTPFGVRSLRASVNSISEYTCCGQHINSSSESSTNISSGALSLPFALYNFALDGNESILNGRGTKGNLFSATLVANDPDQKGWWINDYYQSQFWQLPQIFSRPEHFDGGWCASGVTIIASFGDPLKYEPAIDLFIDAALLMAGIPAWSPNPGWRGCSLYLQIRVEDGEVIFYFGINGNVNDPNDEGLPGFIFATLVIDQGLLRPFNNVAIMTFDPSNDATPTTLESTVALYLNGNYIDQFLDRSIEALPTCTQMSTGPNEDAEYPSEYSLARIMAQYKYSGSSPLKNPIRNGGIAFTRGIPNQIDLNYWQMYNWNIHPGFAP